MIEPLLITLAIFVAGYSGYALYRRWNGSHALSQLAHQEKPPAADLSGYVAGVPGIVLFTADYCTPCKMYQRPAIERLARQIGADHLQVIHVDVQTQPELAQKWGVMSLPTTVIFDQTGVPRHINHGITPTEKLNEQLQTLQKG
jgi:thiol-disulfide isomerase/thioredoxin